VAQETVLHVSESNEWTGGTAQLLALAAGLRERGWDARIACRPGSGLERYAGERGFPVFTVALREDYDLISAWKLGAYIEAEKISVVHAHHNRSHAVCLLAKLLLRLRGKKGPVLVVSRRVSFPPGKNPFSRWKYTSALIDRIVAVAGAIKDVLVAAGVPAERVEVILSGVDAARFAPKAADAAFKKSLGLPEGKKIVGKIANASPWKGQDVFLQAAAKVLSKRPDVHFLLAGRDTAGDWVKGEVAKNSVKTGVALLGFRTDVPELLSCLDVSVNAAVHGEGLSGALRESLTAGVPVVASDVAGNKELLKGGKGGWLYPKGDAAALAERILWVLEHRDEAKKSVEEWRAESLKEFTLESTIANTDALYRRLLRVP
jgi:glycosyltransferase involved in cell wall biosynthesis